MQSAAVLEYAGEKKTLWVEQSADTFVVHMDADTALVFDDVACAAEHLTCTHQGKRLQLSFLQTSTELWLSQAEQTTCFDLAADAVAAEDKEDDNRLKAPMNGRVVAVPLRSGAQVKAGSTVVVVEAMKMEHEIQAPKAGKISEILVEVGQQVAAREILAILDLDGGSSEHAV